MIISIANVRGLAGTSLAYKRRLWAVSQLVETAVDNIATVIGFETGGTHSPSILNKAGSGACGLIQFMPSTARNLGTSTAMLVAMSAVEQLDYVAKYLLWFGKGKLVTLEDTYMSILWPAGIGKPNDYVLFPRGTIAYKQNAGFDRNADGVTKAEVCHAIRSLYESAQGRIEVEVDDGPRPEVEAPAEDPTPPLTPGDVAERAFKLHFDLTADAFDPAHAGPPPDDVA